MSKAVIIPILNTEYNLEMRRIYAEIQQAWKEIV